MVLSKCIICSYLCMRSNADIGVSLHHRLELQAVALKHCDRHRAENDDVYTSCGSCEDMSCNAVMLTTLSAAAATVSRYTYGVQDAAVSVQTYHRGQQAKREFLCLGFVPQALLLHKCGPLLLQGLWTSAHCAVYACAGVQNGMCRYLDFTGLM